MDMFAPFHPDPHFRSLLDEGSSHNNSANPEGDEEDFFFGRRPPPLMTSPFGLPPIVERPAIIGAYDAVHDNGNHYEIKVKPNHTTYTVHTYLNLQ